LKTPTTGAIAIGSVGSLQGSIKAVDLSSMQVIRDKFTILPMPPSIIVYLNGIAEKKRKISKDPIFHFSYDIQRYIEDHDVNIQVNSKIEGVIDHVIYRTTVSFHDRGDIDFANADIDGRYEPPVIISKANKTISPIQLCLSLKLKIINQFKTII
jgi:hypothetical protein